MKVTLRGTRKHVKHQLHVSTWHEPNWIEKNILRKKAHIVNYVGKGTKWFVMTMGKKNPLEYSPVTDRTLLKWLKSVHP